MLLKHIVLRVKKSNKRPSVHGCLPYFKPGDNLSCIYNVLISKPLLLKEDALSSLLDTFRQTHTPTECHCRAETLTPEDVLRGNHTE